MEAVYQNIAFSVCNRKRHSCYCTWILHHAKKHTLQSRNNCNRDIKMKNIINISESEEDEETSSALLSGSG